MKVPLEYQKEYIDFLLKIDNIYNEAKRFAKHNYWISGIIAGTDVDDLNLVLNNEKPMALIMNQELINTKKKRNEICNLYPDKFDCKYEDEMLYFGRPFNVLLATNLWNIFTTNLLKREIALGYLLGYPIENVAAYILRISIRRLRLDGKLLPYIEPQPQISRTPISDVLNDRKELVLILLPTTRTEVIQPLIDKLKNIIMQDEHLDFCVCYRSNQRATPYIVFGNKRLVGAFWSKIPSPIDSVKRRPFRLVD